MKRLALTIITIASLGLAACGGSASGTASAATKKPGCITSNSAGRLCGAQARHFCHATYTARVAFLDPAALRKSERACARVGAR